MNLMINVKKGLKGAFSVPLEARFWAKVKKGLPTECWEWTGSKYRGYGLLGVNGKTCKATRISFELHNGPIQKGLLICHRCDNPPCVNPDHLYAGTYKDNGRDMVERKRNKSAQSDKTHCKRGHPFDKENTYRSKLGRVCKECHRMLVRRWRSKQALAPEQGEA